MRNNIHSNPKILKMSEMILQFAGDISMGEDLEDRQYEPLSIEEIGQKAMKLSKKTE